MTDESQLPPHELLRQARERVLDEFDRILVEMPQERADRLAARLRRGSKRDRLLANKFERIRREGGAR